MSVPKHKRNESKLEAFYQATVLRKQITWLLLKDFGIKDKVRSVENFSKKYKMTKSDADTFKELTDKYGIIDIRDQFPEFIVEHWRTILLCCCDRLIHYIVKANTIYPTNIYELWTRRKYMTDAISECETLLQEMQYIISIIEKFSGNNYMTCVEMIEKEISLLKGWRKSDNSKFRYLVQNSSSISDIEKNYIIEYLKSMASSQ